MTTAAPSHRRSMLVVLALGIFAYGLLTALVTPVLGTFVTELDTTTSTATWILTVYLLSASVCTPILGRLGDALGTRRVLLVSLGGLAVGCVIAAAAQDVGTMIVGRAVQGLGGGVLPLSFGLVREHLPRERVSSAIGLLAAQAAVGGGAGLVLAGPLVDGLGWRWLYWIPLAVTLVAAVATVFLVPDNGVRRRLRLSVLPVLLLPAWLVTLLLGVSRAPLHGWASPLVLVLLGSAVVFLVAWVVAENRVAAPLIDLQVMRRPAVWTGNTVALLLGLGQFAVFAHVPQFVQTPTSAGYGFGADVSRSGLILLPLAVLTFVAGSASGRLGLRFGPRAVIVTGVGLTVPALLGLAFVHDQLWHVVVAVGLLGAGFGLAFASVAAAVVDGVPADQTSAASGMNANIRTVGGSIGTALMTSIVTAGTDGVRIPAESGYTHGFTVLAAVAALSVVAALAVPGRRRRRGGRRNGPEAAVPPQTPATAGAERPATTG